MKTKTNQNPAIYKTFFDARQAGIDSKGLHTRVVEFNSTHFEVHADSRGKTLVLQVDGTWDYRGVIYEMDVW